MKKVMFLFVSATIIFSTTAAQDQKDVPSMPEKKEVKQDQVDWEKKFRDELKLTDEQAAKYDALNKEYKEKIEAVLKDATLDKAVQKEKKMALKKEKEARLFEFLNAEQQAKYKELKDRMAKEKIAKQGS